MPDTKTNHSIVEQLRTDRWVTSGLRQAAADEIERLQAALTAAEAERDEMTSAATVLSNKLTKLESRLAAAEKDAIERCAQLAFDQTSDDPQPGDWNDCARHIAASIRALAVEKPGPMLCKHGVWWGGCPDCLDAAKEGRNG